MKKYSVNVHYDYFVSVDVEAENEEEALEIAKECADVANINELQFCDFTDACVTNVETI